MKIERFRPSETISLWTPTGYVSDSLTLYLDSTISASYPGSGANWNDLSQGIQFVSSGSPIFSTVSGVPSFTFNGTQYWYNSASSSLVDLGGDCTLIMWVYHTSLAARKTIFEKAGTIYASYQQELAVTWEVSQAYSYYSRALPLYDAANVPGVINGSWTMVAIKMSTGRTSASRTGFYSINGAPWTAEYSSRTDTALVSAGEIRIGTGYAGTVTNGSISVVMCYKKMLSDDEIFKNFSYFRTRFGV